MKAETRDYIGKWNSAPEPYAAFHAIMEQVGRLGLPTAYHVDLATDASILYEVQPARFVWGVRECGTHLFYQQEHTSAPTEIERIFGETHWFTYDENVTGRLNPMPVLTEVSLAEAQAYFETLPIQIERREGVASHV